PHGDHRAPQPDGGLADYHTSAAHSYRSTGSHPTTRSHGDRDPHAHPLKDA
ncbi:MAG: hypothetical protein H6637_08050, partial [Ardenticatenales bacterium]|nr:hypothetical protein [Ardenticatenales bacterium]